jgi:threonine aldolase
MGRALELRRKRAGHLWSKSRYLAAQMLAYVTDGLWLEMAQAANAASAALVAEVETVPGARLAHPPAGNMIFAELPRAAHARAFAAGARYYLSPADDLTGPGEELLRCRLVCDWSKPRAEIDAIGAAWRG